VLRKLETRFREQVRISYIMGGLVQDITSFYDSHNDIGGDPDRSNRNIARHWVDASSRHGMPVRSEGFKLFSREHPSTYPQNIAYKAAQIQDQELAHKFLRRIREASAAEARQTNTTEVLLELASEVGLDIVRFLDDFTHGSAQRAFEQDLAITARYGAAGFPSFLLKYGEKEMVIRGYKRYEEFKALIGHLSGGELQERPVPANEETIMAFITRYGSAAPIEIQMTFDLTNDELKNVINSLLNKQLIRKREAGNGYFILPKVSAAACDPATGVCSGL
jgi:predicted DsbA family dithiol-disulfide isomerase